MSDIIDDGLINYNNFKAFHLQHKGSSPNEQPTPTIYDKPEIVKQLRRILGNFNSEFFIQPSTDTQNQKIKLKIIFSLSVLKNLFLIINLSLNLDLRILDIYVSLVDEQKPYKIESLDQRILFCKLFSKSNIYVQNKIIIDLHSGAFNIIRPSILSYQQGFMDILQTKDKSESLQNIIKNTVNDSFSVIRVLLKQLMPQSSSQTVSRSRNQKDLLKTLNRYIVRSPIEPAFDVSFGSEKYDNIEYLSKTEYHQSNAMIKHIITDLSEFGSHQLYVSPDVPLSQLKKLYVKEYFESRQQEINFLKDRVTLPLPPLKLNSTLESKYVYNIIEINQNFQINMKKINMGGFSQISRAEVEFWYMLTVSNQRMEKIEKLKNLSPEQEKPSNKIKKLSKKHLVFKSNNYRGIESGRNRILHENKIVSKFKGVSTVFLPQYFKINNEKSPFSQYLMMEYLAYPNLNEYMELNRISMSFLTKIHLASLIMQSLRFLKGYEIVHMDLKPSNIIVSKRMMIKLIDFGESYNKELCDKNFKPAFSMPYGSPQVFDGMGKNQFTQKNDVYSWGVIFYELLFKRQPYLFQRQQALKVFKERIYLNYMHFVPEQEAKYGSCQIMSILRNVIFRALDKDNVNRPCTIWLTVLLKECLSYLINLEVSNAYG